MTDAELVDAITKGDEISIGYFDESPIKVKNDSVSTEEAIEALKNFLRLTSADRFADSRHPFAYYQFMVHECGNDLLGKQSGQLKEPTQVWEYVTPLHFYFAKSDDKNACRFGSQRCLVLPRDGDELGKRQYACQGQRIRWDDNERQS
ncbi:DUF6985 domain-containing protein [Rhodopirellula europaea]|uniref:DUF6985 domain-containing protein n=1 Tax=Rhodopirellula europaea TaxID=1263866 RepID=UPI003D2D10DE